MNLPLPLLQHCPCCSSSACVLLLFLSRLSFESKQLHKMACDYLPGSCDSPLRISFSSSALNLPREAAAAAAAAAAHAEDCDAVCSDFEFSLEMGNLQSVSADELFCNGKLLPLHLSAEFDKIYTRHPTDPANPEASIQQADKEQTASGLFALPSPKSPKCSIMPGKLLATPKLWRHLVRAVVAEGKRGAFRSSVVEENPKAFARSNANTLKFKPSPASAPASSLSSPTTLSSRRILTASAGRAGGAGACADDLSILLGRKNAFPGRSISMPSSRCSSPRRESAKSSNHKPISGGSERSSPSSSGRVNSGKLMLKNLERRITNQKLSARSHDQSINGMQQKDYPRSGMQQRECPRSPDQSITERSHNQSINGMQERQYPRSGMQQRDCPRSPDQSITERSHAQSINGMQERQYPRSGMQQRDCPKSPDQSITERSHHQSINGGMQQKESPGSGSAMQQKEHPKSQDQTINAMQPKEYQRSTMQHRDHPTSPHKASSNNSNVRMTPLLVPWGTSYKLAKSKFSTLKDLFSPKKETQP